MKLKKMELSKICDVKRQTVNNWINRDKKLIIDENGSIDTENELNRSFLTKKAPFLYKKDKKNEENLIEKDQFGGNSDDNRVKSIIKNIKFEEMNKEELIDCLRLLVSDNPKKLLLIAQYKKANAEATLKQLELQEKLNFLYSKETVDDHFVQLLKIFYDQKRQIGYQVVDKVITMVKKNGDSSRGGILKLIDDKTVLEIKTAQTKLKHVIETQFKTKEGINLEEIEENIIKGD